MSSTTPAPIWHTQATQEVLHTLHTDLSQGLLPEEAARRLAQIGPNELIERGGKRPLLILWEQFSSTMVLILIAAAVISAFLGKPLEMVAISTIVVLFAVLGFVQEYRAEQAMAALKKLSVPLVQVLRRGEVSQQSARELVPGDIVLLEAGNVVPADIRLVESVNLRIQEAALTGESEPVDKITEPLDSSSLPLGDRRNMGYMGTTVSYGRGTGVVVATGMATELGKIAELIQDVEHEMTPLQRQLDVLGKMLAVAGVLVAALIMVIGVIQGESTSEMFLTAVSVAVAVVPEGLPAVVTITLALGAQRMLRRKALIRKLPAVETLGSVTTICSDKTGTLTQNRMTVTVIDVAGHYLELTGTGHHPAPVLTLDTEPAALLTNQPLPIALALIGGALCNDSSLRPDPASGRYIATGDPTEGALLVAASQAGLRRSDLQTILPRVAELPFDSERRRMTTVHRLPSDPEQLPPALQQLEFPGAAYLAFTKGAIDGLLHISSEIWLDHRAVPLDDTWRTRIQVANDQMAQNGMRVLGIALRWHDTVPDNLAEALEKDLVLIGLVGMIDPPRPEVKVAVQTCKAAGIRPIMITGDHPLTARFIAHDLGISDNERVKTGQQLDQISDAELEQTVGEVSVFARVSPEHKLKIVQALQNQGQVVAMTGDGINDSPALKKADIGVAMGITGTDVSKEAAQMVLLDDNFATIVAAVEEGRVIYDNIRRFVRFSVAGNLGKVITMLFAPFLGIAVALLPLQLLWLNLLTDGLLGLGLGVEPAEQNTMKQKPRSPKARLLGRDVAVQVIWVGILIGVIALAVGYLFYDPENPEDNTWQTMIFTTLAFAQIGQGFASRSNRSSVFSIGLFSNPLMIQMVLLTFGLQLAAVYAPFLEDFFEVSALSLAELAVCLALGSIPFIALEIQKQLTRGKPE
ncbi:MAG: cation-translocating P-type ATPase [Chloroflexi bacterium]|nr:cation-translocating P-type ATPase [Chloroflexota bacterium]